VLALEEKRWSLAEKFFIGSLESEPEDAKTHYLLARARFENGDRAGAQAALDTALRLRPNQKEFLNSRKNSQLRLRRLPQRRRHRFRRNLRSRSEGKAGRFASRSNIWTVSRERASRSRPHMAIAL